ncbi:MAG: aminotransferase class V-fold PLP-dependent enzyme [Ignavibacteriales bacterium]|nr:MAG: aminotransferase class V-fold PLP-dependent enzyme [Ignavibacteriales bacterium]
MDKQKARSYFPHLATGMIYMNHAATGPMSTLVKEKLNGFIFDKSENNIDDYKGYLKEAEKVKQGIAAMINSNPDRIAFTDSTTNGLNYLAQGLCLKKGDRIILNDIEFPANVYPFMNLQNEGVEIDFVKSSNGIVTAEDVINSIKPGTKLVAISMVQFLSGFRVDLEKIGKVCREKGIIFSVDAIQGLGALRLDIVKDKIDFISCGTQKWMLGLQGLAFIYISKELQERINPKYVGWLGVQDAWNLLDYKLELKPSSEGLQTGTVSVIGVYALSAALDLFNQFGFDEIEKEVITNTKYFIKRLDEIGLKPQLFNRPHESLSGIVSIKSDECQKYFEALTTEKIFTVVREGVLRISPHFYNTTDDIDRVVEVLRGVQKT